MIQYNEKQLVSKPETYGGEKTIFDEEFTLVLEESELILFKLFGINNDNTEIDLGSIKYQLQLHQLFDQQSHVIEIGSKQKMHVEVSWLHNEELAQLEQL